MPIRWLLLSALAASCLAGCDALAAGLPATAPPPAAPLLGPASTVTLGADRVTLLRSGPVTFELLRSLIDGARSSVHLEVYELGKPDLIAALLAAHARGVVVTVIDDPSEASSAVSAVRLRSNGIDVVDYPVRKLMIDHIKLLIVDSSVAVVGGINWGVNSPANHDYDAEMRGPVVGNLDRVFMRDLVTCGRMAAVPAPATDAAILVATTLPDAGIRPLAMALIAAALHALDLELFVLTDTGIVHALVAARARGVAVRVLLDPSQLSSAPAYAALLAAGVDVRWYRTRGELLHAKAIVADRTSILFGSANWSGGGFARNHELDVELPAAPEVAAQMLAQMDLDWRASA